MKKFNWIPLFTVLLSLLLGLVVIALLGKNPFLAYYNLLQGSGLAPKASYAGHKGMITDFTSFLNAMTPMLLAALSVLIALRAGLFNIGVSGQMLAAGFVSTVLIGYSDLPAVAAKPLVILIGFTVGAFVGALVGFLRHRFNINEVVSTIMCNYIIQYVVSFFINVFFVDPVSRQSKNVGAASRLTLIDVAVGDYKMDIPLGILLAAVCVAAAVFLLGKTTLGFEIKAVGLSSRAAEYAGIRVGRTRVLAMFFSGGAAGLAGVTYYLGYFASIQPRVLVSTGYDAIAVALLGNSSPIGIIFSSFLITVISKGSTYMSSTAGVQAEMASALTGLILLFSACGAYVREVVDRRKEAR
ncbi:MAG: ABC transporter permease [Bacteroidales bacterium]|nr:ABC transporter permease [Bacteroidales bacterium]MCM1416282.1 ABC transporter permease [bacterium]MCM1423479.1 ABC transporter permease [bacterium]